MIHDFLLVSSEELKNNGYDYFYNSNDNKVLIHDDLISYIYDSLLWIPAYNAARNHEILDFAKGFNRWGVSIYKIDGALKFSKVFRSWSDLFAEAPEKVVITGSWCYAENEEDGHYEKLEFSRDLLVEKFSMLANLGERVAESEGQLSILHFGI